MPHRSRLQPDIADVVALTRALQGDLPPRPEVAAREQQLGGLRGGRQEDRVALALAWLDGIEEEEAPLRELHHRTETAVHLTSVLIIAAGMLLGWGTTMAVLYFDGAGRVNAVSVLATLVVLPGLLIVPFLLAALPAGFAQRVPGLGILSALARALSPGRLAPLLWRVFPRQLQNALSLVSGRLKSDQRLYAGLQKWAILRWSQLFAVAFQATALVACLVLVVFSDLAFGWSTTLTTGSAALDARRVHQLTSAAAAPWGWWLDDARPSLELIEESRYYRAAAEFLSRDQAARLGGWWRFVVLTMGVYGLLPRIVTLAIAQNRLRAAARATVLTAPGVSALLRRLHGGQVETKATAEEPAQDGAAAVRTEEQTPAPHAGNISAVINWSGVPLAREICATAFPAATLFAAGGAASVEADVAVTRQLGARVGVAERDVLILVKAWEPPLMEFVDFVTALRGALPQGTRVAVLPVGLDDGTAFAEATPAQFKLWCDKLAAIGDPWLRVMANRAEAGS